MIPSPFGASTSRSSLQAIGVSHASNGVKFSGGKDPQICDLEELDRKGVYKPPPAVDAYLTKQQYPHKFITDTDLSDMTWKDLYRQSPEGQKFWADYRENRKVQLQKLAKDTPKNRVGKRSFLIERYGKGNPNISDEGLISNILQEIVPLTRGVGQRKIDETVVGLMSYDPPHPFDSQGDVLGPEDAPPRYAAPSFSEKSKAAQEARLAWTKNYSAWNRRTNRKLRQPKRTILDRATGIKPLTTRTTIYRRQRTDLRSLPSVRPDSLLQEFNREHPPGLIYQMGLRGARKPTLKGQHSAPLHVQSISPEVKAPQIENKAAVAIQKPVTSPIDTSVKTVSAPTLTERPALQELPNNSNTNRHQSTLKRSVSDGATLLTVDKENAMPSTTASSPFHGSSLSALHLKVPVKSLKLKSIQILKFQKLE